MLKYSKVILCSAVLNLSIFLTVSFSYADIVDKSNSDKDTTSVQEYSIISQSIEKICKDTGASIQENSGNWYKISINGKSGWVFGEVFPVESIKAAQATEISEKTEASTDEPQDVSEVKIQEEPSTAVESTVKDEEVAPSNKTESIVVLIEGVINGDDVNVREGAGKDYGVICQVGKGEKIEILEKTSEWYHIKTTNGVSGWVYSTYVSAGSMLASRGETTDSDTSNQRAEIVSYAKDLLGIRYVYGGSSPSGFDCSGFVCYVFNHFGIKLNRVACDQATQGTKVSKSNLQPGDLVFFDTNGGMNKINHVGIYIGNDRFIHASSGSSAKKVVISDINSGFYNGCYMTGRRVLE